MQDENEVFNPLNRSMIGKILCTEKGSAEITNIKIPLIKNILIISYEDLNNTEITVGGVKYPVLAGNYSYYAGQPLLGVFAKDIETLNLCLSEIEITYGETSEFTQQIFRNTFTRGEIEETENADNKIIKSEYTILNYSQGLLNTCRTTANYSEGILYLKFSSQWPYRTSENVCSEFNLSKKQIVIFPDSYHSPYDQLLIMPDISAIIASAASLRTNSQVELDTDPVSYRIPMKFISESIVDSNNCILSQTFNIRADMGAFPFYRDEFVKNVIAGLCSAYSIKKISVNIETVTSSNPPASFFGDIGYSASKAALENHIDFLADKLNEFPDEFRFKNLASTGISSKILGNSDSEAVRKILEKCSDETMYKRLYAVYSQDRPGKIRINPVVNFSYGVGIACGQGISGFSLNSEICKNRSVTLTLTDEKKLIVSLGIQIRENIKKLCHSIISSYIRIGFDDIIYRDLNSEDICDLGPDLLNNGTSVIPGLMHGALKLLKQKTENKDNTVEYPLTVTYKTDSNTEESFFNTSSSAALSILIHINPVTLTPVIDNVKVKVETGKIYDQYKTETLIRYAVVLGINDVCTHIDKDFKTEISIECNDKIPGGSPLSLIRGLTASSFLSALSQALSHTVNIIHLNPEDILKIIENTTKGTAHED